MPVLHQRHIYGRILMVGGALGSVLTALLSSFRYAALLLAAELLGLFIWRIREPDGSPAWFSIRKKWLDLLFVGSLAVALATFALWVPQP